MNDKLKAALDEFEKTQWFKDFIKNKITIKEILDSKILVKSLTTKPKE